MKKPVKKAPTRRAIRLFGLAMVAKKHGRLMAEDVFEDAKHPKHPLHCEFEWDEKEGWKQWNLELARSLISMHRLEVTDIKTGKSISAPMFLNIHNMPDQIGPQEYRPLIEVQKSKDLMADAMATGIREMSSIVRRWTWHSTLSPLCSKFLDELQALREFCAAKAAKKKHG